MSAPEELQACRLELAAARRREDALGDVLRVMSSSPEDLGAIFGLMLERALAICEADYGRLYLHDAGVFTTVAWRGAPASVYHEPFRPPPETGLATAATTKNTVHIPDLTLTRRYRERESATVRTVELGGARTFLALPLIAFDEVVGVFTIFRNYAQTFADQQVRSAESFARSATLALLNARLAEAERARTRDLVEALERQTATAEVLQVISSSPTRLEPIFDAILRRAVGFCSAAFGVIYRFDGNLIHVVARHNFSASAIAIHQQLFPSPPGSTTLTSRALLERAVVQTEDASDETLSPAATVSIARQLDYRGSISVPMLLEGTPIGTITLGKRERGLFGEKQVALLRTFADQAVIAIENARLFEAEQASKRAMQESLEYQMATSEVLSVISRSPTKIQPIFEAIVSSAAALCGAAMSNIQLYDGEHLQVAAMHNFTTEARERFQKMYPMRPDRVRASGRAILSKAVVHVPDVREDPEYPTELALAGNWRSLLSVPMIREGKPVGVVTVAQTAPGLFSDRQVNLLLTFADQAVIAIENARLFEEVQARTRELAKTVEDLEIASQHKNQFVANMSHELRTPLAAILGYAELIQEGFYEAQGPKSLDAVTRIRSNGKHLLGLINTVLDIAKIESGQFTLNMTEYDIQSIVETVRSATESLAQSKKLTLKTEVAKPLPIGLGDEQRLTQVLLNLVGNAIKFTDTGEVRVTAKATDGRFSVSVVDTGPGIPADQLTRIFEQFHQVDNSNTKAKGGTGLGLAIAKQIVEMHGGRILGRVDARARLDLPDGAAGARRPPKGRDMTKRILVVEDQEDLRGVLRTLLTGSGYAMLEAANGETGVARAKSDRPDLVLMDIQMPVLDGYEATRQIKADSDLNATPVIAVSSFAMKGDEDKARAAGCDHYVTKPYSPMQLLRVIRGYLE